VKVLINISVISKNHRGMGVFTKQILKELISNNNHKYIFVSGNNVDDEIYKTIKENNIKYVQINTPLPFFEQIVIPFLIYKHKPDVCWFPSNTFPIVKSRRIKYIVTIHDLIFLRDDIKVASTYQKIGKLYRKYNILLGINKIDKITSVSWTSLNEINKLFNKSYTQDYVLYNNFIPIKEEDKNILKILEIEDKKFIYTISGTAEHKNLDLLITAFLKLNNDYLLVVSGAKNAKSKYSKYKNIIFTDFITEEQKTTLLKRCDFFVFASLVEGFGIPLIEAMYNNKNVLASDIDVFREIGQNYISYFNPKDENFLVDYVSSSKLDINLQEVQKYILSNFNIDITTKKLQGLFDE